MDMHIKITRSFIIVFSLFIFSACDDLTGAKTTSDDNSVNSGVQAVGGIQAVGVSDRKFRLQGTASRGGDSAHHFRSEFLLPESEEITFYFFGTRSLTNGLEATFRRTNGELHLKLFANGIVHEKRLKSLESVFPDGVALNLEFDIHNDHSDLHTLIWKAGGPRGDRFGCTIDSEFNDPSVPPCVYNSEDFAWDIWLGVGRASGVFWGIQGDSDLILKLEGPLRALSDA